MSKDTQFKKGPDPRRKGAGRPPGAKNTIKLDDALRRADASSKEAVDFLKDVMRGNIKGASPTNQITSAVKLLELSFKYEEKLRDTLSLDAPKATENTVTTPLISLTSDSTVSH